MAELKQMTVQALRDLARKALGRGHSKLKTKRELIEALQAAERKMTTVAGKAATRVREATDRAARATGRFVDSVRPTGKGKKAKGPLPGAREKVRPAAQRTKPAAPGKAPPAERRPAQKAPRSEPGRQAGAVREATAAREERSAPQGAQEPDPEGHVVARIAGEEALRAAPHPMTEGAVEEQRGRRAAARPKGGGPAPEYEEGLGELPWAYADDALMALPRDPKTLFLYWDHAPETVRQAWEGLDGGRPQIWLFAGEPDGRWTRIRVVDFALESRSYYLHDLDPGRIYRAEIHVVDRQGREKLVPRVSNEMMLPPVGPSSIIDDRFMRILWSEPLQRLLRDALPGGPFPDEVRAQLARLSDWSRFSGRVWGGSAGGMGGRPFSPSSSPSAPSSPSSPWGGSGGGQR